MILQVEYQPYYINYTGALYYSIPPYETLQFIGKEKNIWTEF